MLKKTLVAGIAALITLISLYSCNSIVGSPNSSNLADSSSNSLAEVAKKDKQDTVKLMDILDSLNRGKIVFPGIDSINKIDPKVAKRAFRDSIYRELNKKDKHIYLTFDDGPLIGSSAIDSIITSKDVKISTFLVGKHADMSKRLKRDFERYMN